MRKTIITHDERISNIGANLFKTSRTARQLPNNGAKGGTPTAVQKFFPPPPNATKMRFPACLYASLNGERRLSVEISFCDGEGATCAFFVISPCG